MGDPELSSWVLGIAVSPAAGHSVALSQKHAANLAQPFPKTPILGEGLRSSRGVNVPRFFQDTKPVAAP